MAPFLRDFNRIMSLTIPVDSFFKTAITMKEDFKTVNTQAKANTRPYKIVIKKENGAKENLRGLVKNFNRMDPFTLANLVRGKNMAKEL